MCVYKILAHSKDGYVILCSECNHYQLAFGTTGVSFDITTFYDFCDHVVIINNSATCNGFENEKRFKLTMFCDSSMLILNYKELKSLYEIVCEAQFNIEVANLFTELNLITE